MRYQSFKETLGAKFERLQGRVKRVTKSSTESRQLSGKPPLPFEIGDDSSREDSTSRTQSQNLQAEVDVSSQETLLLAKWFALNLDVLYGPHDITPDKRKVFLDEVETLLKAGANPNIVIRRYDVDGRNVHTIQGEAGTSDFIEGTYDSICREQDLTSTKTRAPILVMGMVPILESVVHGDIDMILLLMKHGLTITNLRAQFRRKHSDDSPLGQRLERAITFRDQLLRSFILGPEVELDLLSQSWILSHLAETLRLFAELELSYDRSVSTDKHKVTTLLHQKALQGIAFPFYTFPQQVVQLIIDMPALLEGLMDVDPVTHIAVVTNNLDVLRIALESDRDPETIDFQGMTVLQVAVGNTTSRLCCYLTQAGVDPNTQDNFGISPLLEAVYFGHLAAARALLDAGADIYAEPKPVSLPQKYYRSGLWGEWRRVRNSAFLSFSSLGWSALHIAVWHGSWAMVELLIQRGAKVTRTDSQNRTALDLAIELCRFVIVAKLLDMDIAFDITSLSASILLDRAVLEQQQYVVRQLKDRGVKPPPTDVYSATYMDGNDLEELEGPLVRHALGPHRVVDPGSLWILTRRLPQACCPHVKNWKSNPANPMLTEAVIPLPRACNMCMLLTSHKERWFPQRIPKGSTMELVLKHDRETQVHHLISKVSKSRMQHTIRYVPAGWHKLLEMISALDDRSTGSSSATATSERWLHNCATEHKTCQARDPTYSPTRLVELLDDDALCLVEKPSFQQTYIALSHRWSQDEASKTTLGNYEQRLSPFSSEPLSPTLRDAFKAVKALGHRFVWVDVLCIIQDSKKDWLHEASEMRHVYNNAVITIAAECVDDDHAGEGMFRTRAIQNLRPFHFHQLEDFADEKLEVLIKSVEETSQEPYIFPDAGGKQHNVRPKGILDTRGWILQEQLLSPRILYYGQQQLFWDCISQSASEVSPLATSLLDDANPDETWAFRLLRRTIASNGDCNTLAEQLANVWTHVVQNYSARTLTKPSDKLIALQGIITALEGVLGKSSVAGMWQKDLWKQLMWWTDISSHTGDSSNMTFPAPTWSWLSANGAIFHHQSMRIDRSPIIRRLNDLIPVRSLKYTIAEDHSTATSVSGTLVLSAPTFSYHLTRNDLREILWKRGHPAKLNLAPARWMLDRTLVLPRDVQCVIIAEDEVAKMTVGMCLIPDEAESEQWKRIGLCLWDGLSWQISKYAGKELEDRRFVVV